uniref:Uncharacterized protein n=1 Tax=Kuenenia stuttgartiensis TaxID=174633 RepID=Q1PW63_KUEST|nr:unknown protein [Candidatus Kuenenia stuttgartiensis]
MGSYIKPFGPAISPLSHRKKDETVYFLLHFPSRRRDSALRSTAPYGARTFLPSNNKSEDSL